MMTTREDDPVSFIRDLEKGIAIGDVEGIYTLARELFPEFPGGEVIYLCGELGAGKTTFVKGVVSALGGDPDLVTSPTFALIHRYPLHAGVILHLDLYRLSDPSEVLSLDLETPGKGEALFIEWPERGIPYLPPPSWIFLFGFPPSGEGRVIRAQRLRGAPGPQARCTCGQSPPRS
jgi:tRNA threonylcarbamoyladenosine biosynthesis protein TsaE